MPAVPSDTVVIRSIVVGRLVLRSVFFFVGRRVLVCDSLVLFFFLGCRSCAVFFFSARFLFFVSLHWQLDRVSVCFQVGSNSGVAGLGSSTVVQSGFFVYDAASSRLNVSTASGYRLGYQLLIFNGTRVLTQSAVSWSHTRHQHGLYLPGCRRCGHYHHQQQLGVRGCCPVRVGLRLRLVCRWCGVQQTSRSHRPSDKARTSVRVRPPSITPALSTAMTPRHSTAVHSPSARASRTQRHSRHPEYRRRPPSSSAQSSSSSAAVSSSATPSSSSSSSAAAAVPSSSSQPALLFFVSLHWQLDRVSVCFQWLATVVWRASARPPWCSRASSSTTLHRAASMCPLPVAIDSAISC